MPREPNIELRHFSTKEQAERYKLKGLYKTPSLSPDSICIYSIGYNWIPGAWQKVVDMVDYTIKQNICCWLMEHRDFCVRLPGTEVVQEIRDCGCQFALDRGFEWVMLVENDIMPEPDLALRLIKWDMPVVVPYMRDKQMDRVLSNPQYKPNNGLRRIQWSVLSCILIDTKILNCFPRGMPFGGTSSEPLFFNRLFHYGIRAYQDTDIELEVPRSPSYMGELKNLNEMWNLMKQMDTRRRQPPDHRPIDPKDKRKVYMPVEAEIIKEDIDK
ncbi:hypothetical protein KJ781_04965 [Patescibacteria group bacterium]|uniref:Glycosyltransferase n=1 Tax=viral metagenome TaxID=1070528 RepID=A0A6H1ZM29_9ZZZZ|nr:hypothetical protein [Patescibacteria group bacterium]